MRDQQRLRSACAHAQTDQSLCLSLEYSMTLRLLTEHLEFLSLERGYTGSSESISLIIVRTTARVRNRYNQVLNRDKDFGFFRIDNHMR